MIGLLITLVVLGVLVYFVEQYVPMAPPFRFAVRLVAALIVLVYLLQLIGVPGSRVPDRLP